MDYVVHGILQARILEWSAISFCRDWIIATANSRIVSRIRIMNVMSAVVGLMLVSARVAPPIK